ncbi:MAG TPA: hypothetical protein VMQ56_02480 [Terracidiphilus sp.]|nr:hypothetical protein [Terracidiphilus sp.]
MRWILAVCIAVGAPVAWAQMNMGGQARSMAENILRHTGSGTDLEPASGAPPMLMTMRPGGWMLMLHGQGSAVEQQQTGPRGHDKFFSVNWVMPMAQRSYGRSELTLRAMFSLEPATITGRFYPELFQEGETAYGKPIVDGQHPHNLFMELAGLYDRRVGSHAVLSLYAAPVGDPALGPEAFPHRASVGDDPLAPLGHHLQDSTHIADEVVTGGIVWVDGQRGVRVEAGGFHGREPGENRWTIEVGAIDTWSARLSVAPGKDWVAQYSLGHLHSPEAAHPAEDVLRQTASVAYHHATGLGELNALAVWGRNHTSGTPIDANGYLFEAALRPMQSQTVWTRIENADRTTDLLGTLAPPQESVVGRVQAYTGGYAHRVWGWKDGSAELGAQFTGYGVPDGLLPYYGAHPFGVAAVLAVRLGKGER